MMAPKIIIAFCLNACIILSQETAVNAFSPTITSPWVTTNPRARPLHSFEVMTTVEATAAHSSIMSTINGFFQTQPYLAAFLTCSFKASAADMIAQSKERSVDESAEESTVDVSRNLGFLFYGGIYQGMCQNFIYNVIYPSWFGTDESLALIAKELLVDNLIFAPFLCLPIAYSFKAAFSSTDDELSLDTFRQGLDRYIHDVTTKGLLAQYWKLWFPANAITFGVIPPHFRVVFVACISFFWVCILSSISASDQEQTQTAEVKATPAVSIK